jgi:hypothetical protein
VNAILMGNSIEHNKRLVVLWPRPSKQAIMQDATLIWQWAIKRKWKQRAKECATKEAANAL